MIDSNVDPIQRDRFGRPKIRRIGSTKTDYYTRVSTLAKVLDDTYTLEKWKQRVILAGMSAQPGILAQAQQIAARMDDPVTDGRDELNLLADAALIAGGVEIAANIGTELHAYTEMIDSATEPDLTNRPGYVSVLDAYRAGMEGIEILDTELFVVIDELRSAGTLDKVVRLGDGRVMVADLKGLALDTRLPTPTGWTTMQDIVVGDEVFDSEGKPCTVLVKSATKRIGTYVVTFDDGSEVTCDTEHLWWTAIKHDPFPLARSVDEVRRTITDSRGQNQHRVPVCGALELSSLELSIPPYVLGCWLGDGHVRGGVISKQDDLFEVLESDGIELGVRQVQAGRENVTDRTVIGLSAELRKLDLLYNKHIPVEYLRGSHTQRLALLQGLMDTDGTWNTARRRAVFSSTSRVLADQVAELVRTLGERAKVQAVNSHGFGKDVVAYCVEFTPASFMPFRLPRKAAKVDLGEKRLAVSRRRLIVSVEPGPDVETACIGVDSANSTYLCTDNFIPTHNTGQHDPRYPAGVTTQVSAYSRGRRYDPATGDRAPIHPDLDQKHGLLIHLPYKAAAAGQPTCDLYELDLAAGWSRAIMSAQIKAAPKIARPQPLRLNRQEPDPIGLIASAPTYEVLIDIYLAVKECGGADEAFVAACAARKAQLLPVT